MQVARSPGCLAALVWILEPCGNAVMAKPGGIRRYEHAMRDEALTYPEVHEDFPWGERAMKVKGKVFLFLSCDGAQLSMSMKLPSSRHAALMMPFAKPTGYGLGKAGWVTSQFRGDDAPPLDILRAWLGESYRAVAPKTLVKQLEARAAAVKTKTAAPEKTKVAAAHPATPANAAAAPTKKAAPKKAASAKKTAAAPTKKAALKKPAAPATAAPASPQSRRPPKAMKAKQFAAR